MIEKLSKNEIAENLMSIPEMIASSVLDAIGGQDVESLLKSKNFRRYIHTFEKGAKWGKRTSELNTLLDAPLDIESIKETIQRLEKKIVDPEGELKYMALKRLVNYQESLMRSLVAVKIFEVENEEPFWKSKPYALIARDLMTQFEKATAGTMEMINTASKNESPSAEELYPKIKEGLDVLISLNFGPDVFEKINEAAAPIKERQKRLAAIRNKYNAQNELLTKPIKVGFHMVGPVLMELKRQAGTSNYHFRLDLAQKLTEQAIRLTEIRHTLHDLISSDDRKILGYAQLKATAEKLSNTAKYLARNCEITFASRNGRPVAYIKLAQRGFRYYKGQKPKLVKVGEEYFQMINPEYLDSFLSVNEISDETVYVSENSLDQFYGFSGKLSINLTKSFIQEWANHDCPDLIRYTPNKGLHTNMFDMPIVMFTNTLAEIGWQNNYYDEDLTVDEIKTIIKHLDYPDGRITKDLKNLLVARDSDQSEIEKMESYLVEYDAKVQQVFNESADIGWNALRNQFPDRFSEKNGVENFNDNFGLDCGFIFFKSKDKKYSETRDILRNTKVPSIRRSANMEVQLPMFFQSTTAQRVAAEALVEEVKSKLGYDIYYYTQLD